MGSIQTIKINNKTYRVNHAPSTTTNGCGLCCLKDSCSFPFTKDPDDACSLDIAFNDYLTLESCEISKEQLKDILVKAFNILYFKVGHSVSHSNDSNLKADTVINLWDK